MSSMLAGFRYVTTSATEIGVSPCGENTLSSMADRTGDLVGVEDPSISAVARGLILLPQPGIRYTTARQMDLMGKEKVAPAPRAEKFSSALHLARLCEIR